MISEKNPKNAQNLFERAFGESEGHSKPVTKAISAGKGVSSAFQESESRPFYPDLKEEEVSKALLHQAKKFIFPNLQKNSLEPHQQILEKSTQPLKTLELTMELLEYSLSEMSKASNMILENVVEQMVTKKIYKIRQNFRDLILKLLGIQGFTFFASHSSGRVEFQDFSTNFITEVMEDDDSYILLEQILSSYFQDFSVIDLKDNSDLVKLFQVNTSEIEKNRNRVIVLNQGQIEQNRISICLLVKCKQENFSGLNEVLSYKTISKIVQISQINATQDGVYSTSKNYTKKMFDLLELMIVQYESRLKKSLLSQFKSDKEIYYNVANILKIILSKVDEHLGSEELILNVRKLANQFEETQYKKIEEIRLYKKFVRENNTTLLEFNRVGILLFVSGNKQNQYLNTLARVWEEGRPVLDVLFGKHEKLKNLIKKAMRGHNKSERPLEIESGVKAKIIMSGKKIEKIQIILEDKDISSLSNLTGEVAIIIQKQINLIKEGKAKELNAKTLEQMQDLDKENPNRLNEGWISLFLKSSSINVPCKAERSTKRHKTSNSTGDGELDLKNDRQKSCVINKEPEQIFIQVQLDNSNLNFLNLSDYELDGVAMQIFDQLTYFQRLPQERSKFKSFLATLHDNYQIHSNPFHNFKHGVNVMHSCYLLSTMTSNFNILNDKDIFVIVFSGLCHDVGHTGFTNAFEIASSSPKALMYNDRSPLQNFHASLTFEILRKEQNNFLSHMERDEFASFRKGVIENILFTDIKEHFSLLNTFNDLLKSGKPLGSENASILSSVIVHSSDFAGSTKQFQICREWSARVNQEFSNQYRIEGELGIPQTPFMKDLANPVVISKAEAGFLKVIVYPLYEALDSLYATEGLVHRMKKNIEDNIKRWEAEHSKEVEKAKTRESQIKDKQ